MKTNATLNAKPNIRIEKKVHRGMDTVCLFFEYNPELSREIKKLPNVRWSQTMQCWHIPANTFNLNTFFEALRGVAYIDYSGLKSRNNENKTAPEKQPKQNSKNLKTVLPEGYLEMLEQKRYSENTKKIYLSYMRDFARMFHKYDLEKVTKDQINRYILWLIREKGISDSQQNQRINAIHPVG